MIARDRLVLLVSASTQQRELMAGALRPLGIRLRVADDAGEARNLLADAVADLVLLDVGGLGGEAEPLVREIRANPLWRDKPLLCSGSETPAWAARVCDRIMTAPPPEAIRSQVEELLGGDGYAG